jgi:endonuclease/exonuclease/phosphatase family metal-dependent hydrolase
MRQHPAGLAALAVLAVLLVVAAPRSGRGDDLPVRGAKMSLRGSTTRPARRATTIVLHDGAIAPPLADPRLGGTTLVVHGGADDGQCFASLALEASGWTAIGGDGSRRGYRFLRGSRGAEGLLRVSLRPGRASIRAEGPAWPCALGAKQRRPVTVTLRIGATRYCAAFGGAVVADTARRFAARGAARPAACPASELTVVDLNVLHGATCPPATAQCRLADRVALLFEWIARSGCPDVVTLQEVSTTVEPLVGSHLATACPFPYQAVYMRSNSTDDELILTRWPAGVRELQKLLSGFRTVLFTRIDHPMGPIDVFSSHLASDSDGADDPCGPGCPAECVAASVTTVRECQAVQYAGYVAARHDLPTPAVATGDLNDSPGSLVHRQFADRGWIDTYLAASNPECDPASGTGCTSGRADEDLSQLESPASNEIERIDYVFLLPPAGRRCVLDASRTRLFADVPNPFAPSCGPAPAAICWPSDHEGTQMALDCP